MQNPNDPTVLMYDGNNPNGLTAKAEVCENLSTEGGYRELRVGIYDAKMNCIGDVIITLDVESQQFPRVLITTGGDGDGDHDVWVYPLRLKHVAVELQG